jgi:hypothetical protein
MKETLRVRADCGTSLDRSHPPIRPTMASSVPDRAPAPEKGWRCRLAISPVLDPTIDTRIKELGRGTFSLHSIETVCFNRRIRRNHAVTSQFARDTPEIHDAIDRFIVAHYQPGNTNEPILPISARQS